MTVGVRPAKRLRMIRERVFSPASRQRRRFFRSRSLTAKRTLGRMVHMRAPSFGRVARGLFCLGALIFLPILPLFNPSWLSYNRARSFSTEREKGRLL